MYVVAERGLLHGYEMPDKKLWLLANLPALAVAASPRGRNGTAVVPLHRFILGVALQWFMIGAGARFIVHLLSLRRPGPAAV
jgi:hypothetical protein